MRPAVAMLLAALAPALANAVLAVPGAFAQESGFDSFPPDSTSPRVYHPTGPAPAPRPSAGVQPSAPPQSSGPAQSSSPAQPSTPAAPAPTPWLARPVVELVGLDKVSARTTQLSGPVGQPLAFGTLTVLPRACMVRPPDTTQDAAAFLEIADSRLDTPPFRAWMLLSEPAVSILQHPVYDIRLVGCRAAP